MLVIWLQSQVRGELMLITILVICPQLSSHLIYEFIFCGGDLNARIGAKLDFSVDIDTVTERRSIDCVTNKHGESFLEFLLDNKMCVLNGRVKGLNDFTCVRTQSRSVLDYCFTLHEQIQYI